jgi:hypothetical protein
MAKEISSRYRRQQKANSDKDAEISGPKIAYINCYYFKSLHKFNHTDSCYILIKINKRVWVAIKYKC